MKNIYKTIKREAQLRGIDKPALKDGRCILLYSDLFRRVEGVADDLGKQGVGRASRVAFFCGDSIDYIVGSLAVLSLQAVIVPVPPTSAEHEVDDLLVRIDADFMLSDVGLCRRGNDVVGCEWFIEKEMVLLKREACEVSREFVEMNPAFVRFSSGTTGQSKGVLLSHESIHERTDAADKGLAITAEDSVLWVLSMSYHFVVSILLFLRRGATICLCYDSFPLGLLDSVGRGEGTFIYGSPFHYHTMCISDEFRPDSLKRVRMAISTAMKLQDDVAVAFCDKFGFELTEAYGIIEVGLPFISRTPHKARGSVGRILPDYEIKLLNEDGDGIGKIWIRGKGLYDAYVSPWRVFKKNEWFNTGDLGYVDSDGNLFICGRKKSVINFMGMKVFPDEVEAILDRHPYVEESLVYGKTHSHYGQLPCAKVILCGVVDEVALRVYCMKELSPYKVPKEFMFVDSLPKTASGKLCRND